MKVTAKKNRIKRAASRGIALAAVLILLAGALSGAAAAGEPEISAAEKGIDMGSGAGIDASPGAGTALAEAGDIALTAGGSAMQKEDVLKMQAAHEKYFSFGTTRVLQGIYADTKLYFNIPDYWDTEYVYAALQFRVSEIITDAVPAYLTVMLNGQPVYSTKVSYSSGQNQIVYIRLPSDALKTGYNLFSAVAVVRIYDNFEGCSDQYAWANWITMDKSSYLCAGYGAKDPMRRISYYPYPFVSTVNPDGKGAALLVPDQPANEELAAALYLMADLSTGLEKENNIFFGKYSDGLKTQANSLILVALYDALPEKYKSSISPNDLKDHAEIRYMEEDGKPVLLITADKGENLMEAVHLLLDDARLSQETHDTAVINAGSAALVAKSRQLDQLIAGNYTLKDITGGGLSFVGPFHKEERIYLPFENDYILSSEGKITLKFRYSENLDFTRSLITVFWGDVPIASKKLQKENAEGDELIITMPSDVVGSTSKSIKITFDLEIADLLCTLRQDQMPWSYIAEDSVLYLPSQTNSISSFSYIPSPYQNKGRFADTLVVTSDDVSAEELSVLGQTAALYGNGIVAYGSLTVKKASEFTTADADNNIITAGTYRSNSFLKNLNSSLYFQYSADGDSFKSNSKLVLSDRFARETAALELIRSPYSEGRTILALCATDAPTSRLLAEFLSKITLRPALTGDCVLVDPDLDIRTFRFAEERDEETKPSFTKFIAENKTSALFVLLTASALLMLLAASLIILIRAKKHTSGK